MSRNCTLHPTQPLVAYCNPCRDPVCSLCTKLGPHADPCHQTTPIPDAALLRQRFYLSFRDKEVDPLRQTTNQHLQALVAQEQNLLRQRKVIEKDIMLEFQGITARVEAIVSRRIVKKQTQIKKYQQVINHMDDLVYSFDAVVQLPQRFLLCYKQFHQQLKLLQTMTLNIHSSHDQTNLALTTDLRNTSNISNSWQMPVKQPEQLDLPRQMALSFARANQLPLYQKKNAFCNQIIGKAVENGLRQFNQAKINVVMNHKRILQIYNNQNAQLLQLDKAMVCGYCLVAFSMADANEPCVYNKSYKSQPSYKDLAVPNQIKGGKIHYWVPARKTQRPIPDIKTHSLVRIQHKKQFMNSLQDLKQVRCKLRKYDIEKGTQHAYLLQFKPNDPQNKGKVTPLAFLFIMTNKFQIDEVQVHVLAELCSSKQDQMVEYTKIQELLTNPTAPYRAFQAEEQELQKAKPIAPPSLRFRY